MAIRAIGDMCWHYEDTGDAPHGPLVLLHGFTGNSGFWAEIVAMMNSEFRCIVPDLPGHGRTEAPAEIESCRMTRVAESLALLLTEIGAERFRLWGYSMGGRLALQFATSYPRRVSRLVLESASPGLADENERSKRRQSDDKLAATIEETGVAAFIEQWEKHPLFHGQHRLPAFKQERTRELRMLSTASGLAMSLRGMGTGVQEPLHERLAALKPPTLILVGEDDAKFRSIGQQMAAALPEATYRVVPGAGHSAFWEQPERAVEIVRPFLLEKVPPDLHS